MLPRVSTYTLNPIPGPPKNPPVTALIQTLAQAAATVSNGPLQKSASVSHCVLPLHWRHSLPMEHCCWGLEILAAVKGVPFAASD